MSKPTKEQVAEWRKKYSSAHSLSSEGKECIIFSPFDDIRVMKMAFASLMGEDKIAFVDAIINNCFLWGDESVKTDDQFKAGVYEDLNDIVNIPEFDLNKEGDNYLITVEGKSCKVKGATRQDLKWAEKRNKQQKPFETNIYLVERLALEGVDEFRKEGRLFFALLMAINQCKQKKEVEVKKLW
jgi:hypothetical protein